MLRSFYFSPSGTTKEIIRIIADSLPVCVQHYDITMHDPAPDAVGADDIVLLGAPVYAGRVPQLAAERFSLIKGNGQKAIIAVVYGNRDYDDALLELCDIAGRQGFEIAGAGAFIGQHCIFPDVASDRPDEADRESIRRFAGLVMRSIESGSTLDTGRVKGKRPYKIAAAIPLHPQTMKERCNECGTCMSQCPADAIRKDDTITTDDAKCIMCCRCMNVCPQNARYIANPLYPEISRKFISNYTRRLEPEWFI